ncbi:MAG: ABC transporter permease subunit [Tepidisphaeraceae bacterium]
MTQRPRLPLAVVGFLAPNFVGFLVFTLFPVLLSLWMAFTNWSLKPAVELEFLGLRNFADLLGVRAREASNPAISFSYLACALLLVLGVTGTLWSGVGRWRGTKLSGVVLALAGAGAVLFGIALGAGQGIIIAGIVALLCGLISSRREDLAWEIGPAVLPPLLIVGATFGLWLLNGPMWSAYEARDGRFWFYFYNTLYLMLGIPFSIAGALGLAMLLSDDLPMGAPARAVSAGACVGAALIAFTLLWMSGYRNLAALAGVLGLIGALGLAFDMVAFRTIFYLPTFTAGVALFILWKALYNPDSGPINAMLASIGIADPPNWLGDVAWAKPALILMGIWIGIGGTTMLLYLAGLTNVPKELLDAAEVDGAGRWHRFRHVTWPQLAPTTFFVSIMGIIGGLQGGFEQARVMTNGGPAASTTTLTFYIYNKAYQDLDLGYAAAISWVLFGIIFVATAINWRFGKELEVGS